MSQECSYAEFPALKTESDLRACVKNFQDKVTDVEVVIDGKSLQNLKDYRIQSPLFNFTLPENNVLSFTSTNNNGGLRWHLGFLAPPLPGQSSNSFKGSKRRFTGPAVQNFVADVKYNLTVG